MIYFFILARGEARFGKGYARYEFMCRRASVNEKFETRSGIAAFVVYSVFRFPFSLSSASIKIFRALV